MDTYSKIVIELSKNILLENKKSSEDAVIDYPITNLSTKYLGHSHVVLKKRPDIVIDVNGNEEDRQKTDTEQDLVDIFVLIYLRRI